MRTINVKQLSYEAFRPYGVFQDLLDDASCQAAAVMKRGFYPDLVTLNFGEPNPPTASVCSVARQPKNIIKFIEAHQYTCEGLLPIDANMVIYVGTMGREPKADNIEAFYVPKGTFVRLDPLILHGCQFVNEQELGHALCLLPARTFFNDMIFTALDESEQIEVV